VLSRSTTTRETAPARQPVSIGFSGLRTACVSCHIDVHRAELGTSCDTCHTARSFQVANFTHARLRPFFDGQHAMLRCAQCHTSTYGATPTPPPTTSRGTVTAGADRSASSAVVLRVGFAKASDACASCHVDVHLGQVSTRCETCHIVATPRFAVQTFQHSTTKFPLTGKHMTVACQSCHTVATQNFPAGHGTARRLTGMGTACASCHQDPHKGELGASCERCHSTDTFAFSGRWYVHSNRQLSRTFFVGRHVTACVACHKRGRGAAGTGPSLAAYVIPTACTSCHTDIHRGALGPRCESCHTP
jgi:class III cytochrome C family protein